MRFISSIVVAVALCSASTAMAQDRERAREEFNRGLERYEADDFRAALEAFQEAYRIAPHPNVRVNMANCYERLDRPLEAIFHYERFLAEATDAPSAQRREVERALRGLLDQTGEVSFQVQPDGALIRIDGAETRRAPILSAVRMTSGSHRVEVQMDGFIPVEREFIVEGGQPANVSIRLERGEAPPPTISEDAVTPDEMGVDASTTTTAGNDDGTAPETGDELASQTPPGDHAESGGGFYLGTPTLISAGVTGAFLVTALITGIAALGADGDFDDAVVRSNDPAGSPADRLAARQEGLDAKDRANTLALVTDIMLIGAAVGAGVTAFFFLTQEEQPSGEQAGVGASVAPSPDGASVLVHGRF